MKKYDILIVDDAEIELDGLAYLLKKYDYPFTIYRATNGHMALGILEKQAMDLIITDIRMPNMTGLELIEAIRNLQGDTNIIISSAYRDFSYAKKAIQLGVEEYLIKPVNVKEFKSVISNVLDKLSEKEDQTLDQANTQIFQYIYGKESSDMVKVMAQLDYAHDQQYALLVVYNSHHFFDYHLDKVKVALSKMKNAHLYVNINEFKSLILIPKKGTQKSIGEDCNKLYKELSSKDDFIFCASKGTFEIQNLHHQFNYLNDLIENQLAKTKSKYITQGEAEENYTSVEQTMQKTMDFICEKIQLKDLEGAEKEMVGFFDELQQTLHYSAIFVKYLLCNIADALILNFQLEENASEVVDQIMKSNSLGQLREKIMDIFKLGRIRQNALLAEKKDVIQQAVHYIHQHYNEDIRLQDLADHVFLTPNYLGHLFKIEMGQTVTEYLIQKRLQKAKYLLSKTPLKIAQISREIGYENVPYFTSLFKKYYEMTPSEARKAWR